MKRALLLAAAVTASCLVGTGAASADPAPVYCGANDVVDPTIGSVSMSPETAVVGKVARTVTVTVSATDDCAIGKLEAVLGPKGVGTLQVIYLTNWTRIAGTPSNGTWRASKTLSWQERGGVWEIFKLTVTDTYYNYDLKWRLPDTMHIRHATSLKLNDPRDKVYKTVTLVGRLRAYGDYGTWKVKIQSHKPGKKWKTIHTLTTNGWGDFSKKVNITGTTYFRAVHDQSNTTVAATSKSYKVKKKK